MIIKYDGYECEVRFILNSMKGVNIFDDLERKEIEVSNSIKFVGLKKNNDNEISGRMIINYFPGMEHVEESFLRDINELLNLFGIKAIEFIIRERK